MYVCILTLQLYLQPILVKILVRDLESSNFCRQEPGPQGGKALEARRFAQRGMSLFVWWPNLETLEKSSVTCVYIYIYTIGVPFHYVKLCRSFRAV